MFVELITLVASIFILNKVYKKRESIAIESKKLFDNTVGRSETFQKVKLLFFLLQYKKSLEKRNFLLDPTEKFATVYYERLGVTHPIFIPYKKRLEDYEVVGFLNKNEFTITQQKGVPYFLSVKELGFEKVEVRREYETSVFEGDQIPEI